MSTRLLALLVFSFSMNLSLADSSGASQSAIHDVDLGECHFTIRDPFGGIVTRTTDGPPTYATYHAEIGPKAQRRFETEIQFECHSNVTIGELSDLAGVIKENGKWVVSLNNVEATNAKLHILNGHNWDGAGITQDETGEAGRRRSFTFCITHKTQVVCGQDDTVMYLDIPRQNVLPQIIRLLDSIEFSN